MQVQVSRQERNMLRFGWWSRWDYFSPVLQIQDLWLSITKLINGHVFCVIRDQGILNLGKTWESEHNFFHLLRAFYGQAICVSLITIAVGINMMLKEHLCKTLAILALRSRVSLHRHVHVAVDITPGPCVHFWNSVILVIKNLLNQ